MTRQDFIEYLIQFGCEVVREANGGYSVMRNITTKQFSGVPATDPPKPLSVCRICKTLGVTPPEVAIHALEIINQADKISESESKK